MNKSIQNFFIIGNPRSGTSLFRIMLDCHSSIAVPPECGFIQWWHSKYNGWSLENTKNRIKVNEYINDLKTSRKIHTWNLDFIKLEESILTSNISSYSELSFAVINFFAKSQGKQNPLALGDKNNYYINHLELLHKIDSNAKYVIIYRDPLDVVCSYKDLNLLKTNSEFKPKLPIELKDIIRDWVNNHKMIIDFTEKLPHSSYKYVNFQSLVFNTKDVLSNVTSFLNLDFEEEMLNYFHKNSEPKELIDWKRKTTLPIDTSVVGRYKLLLDIESQKLVKENTKLIYARLEALNERELL